MNSGGKRADGYIGRSECTPDGEDSGSDDEPTAGNFDLDSLKAKT